MVRFPTPTSEVPRPITPVQVIAPIALPNEKLDQRGSYPPAWQDLIDLATTFALHDMLFSNPFPSKEEALSYGGEAAGWAHSTYKQYHSTLLCSTSCKFPNPPRWNVCIDLAAVNAHRSSIAKIVREIFLLSFRILTTPCPLLRPSRPLEATAVDSGI